MARVKEGKQYRNLYTGKIVTVRTIESVRVGPGEIYKDVAVLDDGSRWRMGDTIDPFPHFSACHEPI